MRSSVIAHLVAITVALHSPPSADEHEDGVALEEDQNAKKGPECEEDKGVSWGKLRSLHAEVNHLLGAEAHHGKLVGGSSKAEDLKKKAKEAKDKATAESQKANEAVEEAAEAARSPSEVAAAKKIRHQSEETSKKIGSRAKASSEAVHQEAVAKRKTSHSKKTKLKAPPKHKIAHTMVDEQLANLKKQADKEGVKSN